MLRMKIFTEAHCITEIIPKIRLEKKKTRPLSIKRKQKRYTDSWVRCAAPTRALPGENGYCRTYVLTEK